LFGEAQSRVVVSVSPSKKAEFEKAMSGQNMQFLGLVTNQNDMLIDGENFGNVTSQKAVYDTVLEKHLG